MAAKIESSPPNYYFVAHRGASYDAPENTLAAVNLAWRQRADAVEIDVHLSRDGKLMVIHDGNTRRTTGVNHNVSRQTLAELRQLDAGRWKGLGWLNEKIPTLEEVLACAPPGRRVFIEIKARENTVPALLKALAGTNCRPAQIVIIGFSLPAMRAVKRKIPKVEVCWLAILKRHQRTRRWPAPDKLIQKIKAAGLNGLNLAANRAITPGFVKKIRGSGLKLYVWTVDSAAEARKLGQSGVDGITTNRPGWLRAQLGM